MKKKILSLILCSALAFSGVITANAVEISPSSFTDLKTQYQLSDTTILTHSYNIEPDYPGKLSYQSYDEKQLIRLNFIEAIETPQMINFNACDKFCLDFSLKKEPDSFYNYSSYLKNKGGVYRKVKIKLSDFSDYFTEDGSLIFPNTDETKTFTENFKKKSNEDGTYYNSVLFIKSGASHTAAIPDENGEVEFYLYLNPCEQTRFYCTVELKEEKYTYTPHGFPIEIHFGDVNQSYYVDVNDVTQIQLALAGAVDLDNYGKFNADINLDGIRDVKDVTALQLALAKAN